MKVKISLYVFLFGLVSCSIMSETHNNSGQLSDFLIGKWVGIVYTTDIHGSYEKEYHIEFLNNKTLALQMIAPYSGINDEFTYGFIEEDTLLVENKRAKGGQWTISRIEDDLMICIWSDDNCIRFTREN